MEGLCSISQRSEPDVFNNLAQVPKHLWSGDDDGERVILANLNSIVAASRQLENFPSDFAQAIEVIGGHTSGSIFQYEDFSGY